MARPTKEESEKNYGDTGFNTNPNEQKQMTENKYLVTYLSPPGVETMGQVKKKKYNFVIRPWEREKVYDLQSKEMLQIPEANKKTIEDGDAIVVDERTYREYIKSGQWSDKPKFDEETQMWNHDPFITIETYFGDLPSDGTGIIKQYKKQVPVDKKALIEEIRQNSESSSFDVLRSTAKLVPGAN